MLGLGGQAQANFRSKDWGVAEAILMSAELKVNRALTSVNLLKNDLGNGAAAVVAAAKQNGHIKTLCGIEEGQTEVNLRDKLLGAPDAVLLSFDLEFNRSLALVNLLKNDLGGGAAAIVAAALARATLSNGSCWPPSARCPPAIN